jgi:hypothetical protein
MNRIVKNMNSKRYTNYFLYLKNIKNNYKDKKEYLMPTFEELNNLILNYKPAKETGCSIITSFDNLKCLPIIENYFANKEIWVYDCEKLVKDSPFINYNKIIKTIGVKRPNK